MDRTTETNDKSSPVVFNIGGKTFRTVQGTLNNIPGTRLANLNHEDASYNSQTGEYYFDRSPVYFEFILDFYRTGQLHFSHCLCGPSIQKELEFWMIDENCISPCCWKAYKTAEEEADTMKELAKTLMIQEMKEAETKQSCCPSINVKAEEGKLSYWQRFKQQLWAVLERPHCSLLSKIWAVVIFILIVTSIMVVALETHPDFRIPKDDDNQSAADEDEQISGDFNSTKRSMFFNTDLHPLLYYLDTICTLGFFIELALRFISSPSKSRFFKSVFNVIDIFCVVPMLIVWLVQWFVPEIWSGNQFHYMVSYLSVASVLRVFRLLKLARHYRGLQILQLAVRSSLRELFLLIILIIIGMLVFSTLGYYAEFNEENEFTSIPKSFWWSIITMTTVGYGDMAPDSSWGYLVGSICAIAGTLIMGLPIPIIASNFNHYYKYSRLVKKIEERKQPLNCIWKGRSHSFVSSRSYTYSSQLNLQNIDEEHDSISHISLKELPAPPQVIPPTPEPTEPLGDYTHNNNNLTARTPIRIDITEITDDNGLRQDYLTDCDSAIELSVINTARSPHCRHPSSLSRSVRVLNNTVHPTGHSPRATFPNRLRSGRH